MSSGMEYACSASPNGAYAFCMDNLVFSAMDCITFDYRAGSLTAGGPALPKQDDFAGCVVAGANGFSAQFTPNDCHFVWSVRHSAADPETFWYRKVGDLDAPSDTSKVKLFDSGETRVRFAADGKTMLYLSGFSPAAGVSDLMVDSFPPSPSPKLVKTAVTGAIPLDDGTGRDRGVAFRSDVVAGAGTLWMLRDDTMPASKVIAASGVCRVNGFSRNLERALVAKTCDPTSGVGDLHVLRLDPATGAGM